MIRED